MKQLRVTDDAKADLVEILFYVSQDNEVAANTLVDRITEKFDQLLTTPGMGREREDLAPALRSFPVGKYFIFYRQTEEGIDIVRVLHGARDIENIF